MTTFLSYTGRTEIMKYQHYTLEDFLLDEKFKAWVETPDRELDVFWTTFLKDHPEKQGEIEEARDMLEKMHFRKHNLNTQEVSGLWNNILREKDKVSAPENEENVIPLYPDKQIAEKSRKIWSGQIAGIAAAISAILMIAGIYYMYYSLNTSQELAYATAFGETKTISLPDGSFATLNANSSLRIPADWEGHNAREVWLEGEAFFQVKEISQYENANSQMPYKFVVHSQDVAVEVLGTQFNVNTRREKVQVVLNTGKVRLKWQQQEVLMKPGELVEVNRQEDEVSQRIVKPEIYSSWKDNQLLCDTTPLSELARTIEDRFGYEVVFLNDNLSNIQVSGTIPMDSIETFNLVLSKLIKARFELKGNKVFISK